MLKKTKTFNEFESNLNALSKKMELMTDNSKKEIESIKANYEVEVIQSLQNIKENINKLLNEKVWEVIKAEIDSKMMEHLGKFNEEINNFFENISYNSFIFYQKGEKYFTDFTEGEISLDDFPNFKDYFLEKVSNKEENYSEELAKEIRDNIDKTMTKILNEKCLFEVISS